MNDRLKWAKLLNALLHDNFYVAKCYRKTAEAISDVSLKYYFQQKASRRSQFAVELDQEISYLGGRASSHLIVPSHNRSFDTSDEDPLRLIRKCIKMNKASIRHYQLVIPEVNEGSTREILFRHKARITASLKEFKSLKSLMKSYQLEQPEQLRKID